MNAGTRKDLSKNKKMKSSQKNGDGVRTAKKQTKRGPLKCALPPSLLTRDGPQMGGDEMKKTILSALSEFGIDAEVTHMEHRSGVTSFKLLPAAGVQVSRICGLRSILSLALNADYIRIQAPISGKRVVVIEVPNPKATLEMLRKLSDMMRIAFIEIRGLAWNGRAKQAGDLADAFHELPTKMWKKDFSLQFFRDAFVRQYQRKHPGGRLFDYVALVDEIIAMKY